MKRSLGQMGPLTRPDTSYPPRAVLCLDRALTGYGRGTVAEKAYSQGQGVVWRARALQVELGGHWPPPNPPEQRRILRDFIWRLCCPQDA